MGLACFFCGTTIGVRFDVVGELYLLEPLVALLALQCTISRGLGKQFVAPLFFSFVAAGLITFCGYLLADLSAANEPWQYLKGWGRVVFLITDSAALMLLSAHGRQNIWWLALGIGLGGVAALAINGVPVSQWKLGYGEFAAILVVTLAPLLPPFASILLIAGFGAGCLVVDYRSLGTVCLIIAAIMLWQRMRVHAGAEKNLLSFAIVASLAAVLLGTMLWLTQEQYAARRQESNVGRYVGLLVAWRAITESPWVGYGSWAADEKFGRMVKSEVESIDRESRRPVEVSRSLIPHSELLQVWIEGGVMGLAFFGLYGVCLVGALRWIVLRRPLDTDSALLLFFIVSGLWNLSASQFLGIHRTNIAIAVAAIAVVAYERKKAANATEKRSTSLSNRTSSTQWK